MARVCTVLSILFCVLKTNAQVKITPQALKIYEDNDFINLRGEGTDQFYTNGTRLAFIYTKQKERRYLSSLLLPISNNSDDIYEIGINQFMFTPSDITIKGISYGQRPYAGLLFINHTLSSSDAEHNQKLTTEVDLGVIGPLAFAREVQTFVHKEINTSKPEGWDNQVNNDIVFNYMIQYEKLLVSPMRQFEMIGLVEVDAGTITNKVTTGVTFRMGTYNSYFKTASKESNNKKEQFYFFIKPAIAVFLDNSILQGGRFTGRNSPYTITQDSLNHYYMQFEYGFFLGKGRNGVAITEKLRTAEFIGAENILVGNLTFFVGI